MRSKRLLLLLLASFSMFPAFAQTKLIEKVVKKGNELVIPYEKYQLANGLTVIVHEDHSDPMVFVQVTYHVGSAREQEGRSGFAHFFEHMMFQGSDHVGDDEHFRIITSLGSSLDGQTERDQTRYFQSVPANHLETVFWLESDRMGYFLDSVTQAKFEIQRATVKNERQQNTENIPYGRVFEETGKNLYWEGHPYSWPVLGYIDDLNRVDVSDLKKFFLRWYNPNNATLTVAGDVKAGDVIKLAEKYFGPIPAGPAVNPQVIQPVSLVKDRYVSYEDNNIKAPRLVITFPTVPNKHPDEAALDALAFALGGSKSSVFEKKFVNSGIASSAIISHPTYELAGEWCVELSGFQNTRLSSLDSLCRSTLASFEKTGISDEELKMFKANYETPLITSLESVKGKGMTLASNQVFSGNPNDIVKDLQRYKNVTKEDVMRVYKKYIKNKYAVYLSVYPKGNSSLIARQNDFPPTPYTVSPERDEYKNLVYNKAPSSFDRSKRPVAGPDPTIKVPDYWTKNLDNGLKITGAMSNEVPTITIQLHVEAGHRYEPLEKSGIAELLIGMMKQSTQKYSAEQLSNKLNLLGSIISIYGTDEDIIVTVSTLTKNMDATLALVNEMVFHPKFDAKEFERVKKQQLDLIENQATQPKPITSKVFSKLLYGGDHIMSTPTIGTKESVSKLTVDDVKEYYSKRFSQRYASLVIVGDISKEALLPKLGSFNQWNAQTLMHQREPALPEIDKTRIYFVDKPNAPQSEIRVGYMALPYDATGNFFKATVMNYPLGSELTSRINMNLREQHGYTYYSRSYFNGGKFVGPYYAFAGIRTDATGDAVAQTVKEIKNYADKGITQEELKGAKSAVALRELQRYETPAKKAGFIKMILDYGLEKDFTERQRELLESLTVEQINEIAKKYLPYDKMYIVVVGDKAKVYDDVRKLGYEVVELDANGDQVKN